MDAFGHILHWKLTHRSHPFPGKDGTCINEAAIVAAGSTSLAALLVRPVPGIDGQSPRSPPWQRDRGLYWPGPQPLWRVGDTLRLLSWPIPELATCALQRINDNPQAAVPKKLWRLGSATLQRRPSIRYFRCYAPHVPTARPSPVRAYGCGPTFTLAWPSLEYLNARTTAHLTNTRTHEQFSEWWRYHGETSAVS